MNEPAKRIWRLTWWIAALLVDWLASPRFAPVLRLKFSAFWTGITVVVLAWEVVSAPMPQGRQVGREIYRQLCARCHGRNGEGVPGEYKEALQGDWSVEKLARVIEKTMPEDAPGKCVGADASAVAGYIHETFYSREARARKNPPRVEMARLTNRQFLNTAADLFRSFAGEDPAVGSERGLDAVYYNSRGFDGDRKAFERVDRQVNFEFGMGSPDPSHMGSTEFSVQWRGSLLTDETGEHEFVLESPNGVRLWLNDEEEPAVDGWVASGGLTEHRFRLRLIGGRAYPLRLNYFKFKDKSASVRLLWKPPHGVWQPVPARNLSTSRSTPTLVLTAAFPADDSSVGYERGVSVSKAWDEAVTQAAIEIAGHVVRQLDRLSRSKSEDSDRRAKVQAFCEEFVAAAFHRPLDEELRRSHVIAQFQSGRKLDDSVRRVVLLAMKSPRFLYLGLDAGKGGDYEVASRLSYALWDSVPDKELLKQASAGGLRTRASVVQQAQRMLEDARAHSKMQSFLHHWLQLGHVEDLSKDAQLFPGFSPEVIADLRTSLNLGLEDAVWSGVSDYRNLLLSERLYMNDRLAKFYGVRTNITDEFLKVGFDPRERSGVITHPYLLAAFSYQKSTSPIHRGVFLTRHIVGRTLRPPPVAVVFKDADFSPNLTMREKITELTRPQSCQSCHAVINPLGFSLEQYDAVGRFRPQEGGRRVDSVSDYVTEEGESIRLTGGRDLAEFAAGSDQAHAVFIETLFHHVVKQPMAAHGPEVFLELRKSFVASGFNMRQLLVEVSAVSALHFPVNTASTARKSRP